MKTKIQIKSIDGDVLFEYEKENNTIKDTVEEAVRQKVNLSGANLHRAVLIGADLRFADLSGAYLRGSSLYEANLHGANLNEADLRWADIHKADLSGAYLREANISGAYLRGANLSYADIIEADLTYAYLNSAHLREANLHGANLYEANLIRTNLSWSDLSEADLRRANLYEAYLSEANLRGTNLNGANLYGATLYEAKNIPQIPLNCPSEGAFIAWKKVEGKLVKLEISEDAKRSSATTNKCRCDKAKVLSITDLDGNNPIDEILNTSREHELLYKVGEMVYPDSFDEDRWHECSHGIHFFINKQDAINY